VTLFNNNFKIVNFKNTMLRIYNIMCEFRCVIFIEHVTISRMICKIYFSDHFHSVSNGFWNNFINCLIMSYLCYLHYKSVLIWTSFCAVVIFACALCDHFAYNAGVYIMFSNIMKALSVTCTDGSKTFFYKLFNVSLFKRPAVFINTIHIVYVYI